MSTSVLTVIPRNTKLTVTAISGIWFKVTYGGRIGWVHSDFVI